MKNLKEHLVIICVFILLTIFFTYPLIANLCQAQVGPRGKGDQLLNLWIISWDNHIISRNPLKLFQANINYPSSNSFAFTEPLLSIALATVPLKLVTSNPVAGYNLLLILSFALCGYTLYLLVKYLTGNRLAAFVAGVFYAFLPYHFSILPKPQESFYFLLPLFVLLFFRYFEIGRVSYLVGWAAVLFIQGLASPIQGAIFFIPVGLFLIWRISAPDRGQNLKPILYTLLASLLCLLLLLPLVLPYLHLEGNKPKEELDPPTEVRNAAKPRYYISALEQNYLYGSLGFKEREIGEGVSLFPGFLGLILGAAGFLLIFSNRGDMDASEERKNRRTRGRTIYFVALGLLSFILCLGPHPRGYYNFIYRAIHYLPPYRLINSPLRYHLLVVFSLSVMVGYGGSFLHEILKKRWSLPLANFALSAISLLLVLELLPVNIPLVKVTTASAIPQAYLDISQMEDLVLVEAPMPSPGECFIFEDPLNFQWEDKEEEAPFREREAAYLSTFHWKHILNGRGDYQPIFYRRLLLEMEAFPSARTLSFLQGAGVDYILLRRSRLPEHARESVYKSLAEFPGLSLERCYPDGLSLYRFDRVEPTTFDQLEINLFCPSKMEPGVEFSAGLVYTNPTARPLVNPIENKQYVNIFWIGESGEKVKEERVSFFLPIMIDCGEGAVTPLELKPPSREGNYRLLVEATDGPLAGSFGGANINVAHNPTEEEEEVNKGALTFAGDANHVLTLNPSEPFSLTVKAENQGNRVWRRKISKLTQSVTIKASWQRHGPWEEWEEQLGLLPSDIAPSQAFQFPICLQAPQIEGEYTLRLALFSSEEGRFGREIKIRVRVIRP